MAEATWYFATHGTTRRGLALQHRVLHSRRTAGTSCRRFAAGAPATARLRAPRYEGHRFLRAREPALAPGQRLPPRGRTDRAVRRARRQPLAAAAGVSGRWRGARLDGGRLSRLLALPPDGWPGRRTVAAAAGHRRHDDP